jgi:dienelactone hydrolase
MTGTTLHTAVAALRASSAREIMLATPAATEAALASLSNEVDDVFCPSVRGHVLTLSEVYEDAAPVSIGYARDAYARFERERARPATANPFTLHRDIPIPAGNVKLAGTLTIPAQPKAVVAFLHGSGSNRFSSRNQHVAAALEQAGFATLLFDFLTAEEQAVDGATHELREDVGLLGARATAVLDWLETEPSTARLPVVLFGASSGAAAALLAAAARPERVRCVVSRGGRPDLAETALLERITTPTLLLVGSEDHATLELNRAAAQHLSGPHSLRVVPGATRLFPEPGSLSLVADLTLGFLNEWLPTPS